MSFDQKTQSVINLPFRARRSWPPLWPAYVWRGVCLAGQVDVKQPPYVFSDQAPIEDLLHQIYPELGWLEVLSLTQALQQVGIAYRADRLWELYGHRENPELSEYQRLFGELPQDVRAWLVEKDFGPRDLAPFKVLPNLAAYSAEFSQLVALKLSKSEFQRAIEIICDLVLMQNLAWTTVLKTADTAAQVLERLEDLRKPMAAQQKRQSEELLKRLAWPRRLQARVTRIGDLSGFEIKFFAHNREEFQKHVEGLQTVARQLNDDAVERF